MAVSAENKVIIREIAPGLRGRTISPEEFKVNKEGIVQFVESLA